MANVYEPIVIDPNVTNIFTGPSGYVHNGYVDRKIIYSPAITLTTTSSTPGYNNSYSISNGTWTSNTNILYDPIHSVPILDRVLDSLDKLEQKLMNK